MSTFWMILIWVFGIAVVLAFIAAATAWEDPK